MRRYQTIWTSATFSGEACICLASLGCRPDVALFRRSVSRYHGLFYFDSSFRPVPLEQHFLGIKGKTNSPAQKKNMDEVVFEKVRLRRSETLEAWPSLTPILLSEQVTDNVREGHQVMVFVHARKETVKSGMTLHDQMQKEGTADDYDCTANPQWERFHRDIGTSKNKEMKELFMYGIGIHHAGMLRSDRNLMERAFESNCLKVNLGEDAGSRADADACPACARSSAARRPLPGVSTYLLMPSSSRALRCTTRASASLSISRSSMSSRSVVGRRPGRLALRSDLCCRFFSLQIFGRAGRPGYETSGVGYICTPQEKVRPQS